MKHKTEELYGTALDWAVAKAEGLGVKWDTKRKMLLSDVGFFVYAPSADWSVAGVIIEREKMGVWFCDSVIDAETDEVIQELTWYAEDQNGDHVQTGSTPLVAAMRCYVASVLGDEIEIPEGLK